MTQWLTIRLRWMIQALVGRKDNAALLLQQVLNQVLEAEVTEHLQADRYERTEGRQGYRNGSRSRQLTTRVGTLTRDPGPVMTGLKHDTMIRIRLSGPLYVPDRTRGTSPLRPGVMAKPAQAGLPENKSFVRGMRSREVQKEDGY